MIRKLFDFLKKHPLLILLWISVASISGFTTWIILLSPETKALRVPPSCKIPLPQIPLEFIEPANPAEFTSAQEEAKIEEPKETLCWEKNAIAFEASKDLPKFALIVTGLGLNQDLTIQAIRDLPAYVTLSFSPYTYDLDLWVEKARESNHEVLMDLPWTQKSMPQESPLFCDGGPLAMDDALPLEENLQRLKDLCQKASHMVGFNMRFVEAMKPDLKETMQTEIMEKGFLQVSLNEMFSDSEKPSEGGVKPVFIQSNALLEDIIKHFSECENACLQDKKHIVMMEANPAMIRFIQDWSKNITDKPFLLAPLTSLRAKKDA